MVRVTVRCAAVVLLCLGLTGCGTSPSPEPSPTASGFADEAEAFAAAEETYRAYVDALNRVDLSDPETFEDVYAWTTGELNASDRKSFSAWHAEGYSLRGEAIVQQIEPLKYEFPEVLLHACYDVSGIDVVDAGGESLVSPDRPGVQSLLVSLEQSPESSNELLVSAINPSEDASC
ncbi:hypothetical protein [Microbacterium sp. GXF7504]